MCGRTTHYRPTQLLGHPSPRSCRHWRLSDLYGILGVVAIPHPMGSLEALRGGRPWRAWQTAPNCGKNPAPKPTMRRSQRESKFYRNHRSRIPPPSPRADRNGHHAASMSPYRCHQRYRLACPAGSTNYTPQRRLDAEPPRQPRSTATGCRHSSQNSATSLLP